MQGKRYPLEPLFGRILSPFERFLRRTTAGGIVLVATTTIALALATAIGAKAFNIITSQPLAIAAPGRFTLELSVLHWVNDGLMALFFLLVGLELKREVLVGELSSLRDAALPVFAALGGMLVPGVVYYALNAGTPSAAGWGIPMATDIAFAVGILVLLAWRIPKNLIIFLTALAASADIVAALVLCNQGGIRHPLPYALAGVMLWLCLHASGVHATLAGILLAMTIPARPAHTPAQFEGRIEELQAAFRADRANADTPDDPLTNERMTSIAEAVEHSAVAVQSPLQRIEHGLTPWVTFVVIPVFALVNAGIDLSAVAWREALGSSITLGIVCGLVLGKFAGIAGFSWIAVRLRLARLPTGVQWKHLLGAAWLAGIGFTMSLFIAQLAFTEPVLVDQAKLGILLGSAISAIVGLVWLYLAGGARDRVPMDHAA